MSEEPSRTTPAVARVGSIDAFRGLVMFLMLAEVMRLWTVAEAFPGSAFWAAVAYNTTHVPWQGCSLHDLIQPAFSFLVGASLPFSMAARRAGGQSDTAMLRHAVRRSLILVFLGIFLRSLSHDRTYWTFEDTLTQIGIGYVPLFLLARTRLGTQVAAVSLLLAGFWLAFVLYPVPDSGFSYPAVGVPADWPHLYSGFLAHFNKNSNLAWAFDTWFLNLFPRESPFLYNSGGWSTLSFVPTLATMVLGAWAGGWLRTDRPPAEKARGLAVAGVGLALAGWLLQALHVCPIVKRIWTSSYTLYSGGLVVLMLAAFVAVVDWRGWRRWTFPLLVIGANSITAYVMSWTMEEFVVHALGRHVGSRAFLAFGAPFEPVLRGASVLLVFWLALYWMYRQRIFVRI
jgi:predicted acyltransferase